MNKKNENLIYSLETVVTVFILILILLLFPASELNLNKSIGFIKFVFIFAIPLIGVFGIVVAALLQLEKTKNFFHSFSLSVITGAEAGYACLGLVSLYLWHTSPENPRLESVVAIFAVAAAFSEGCRRLANDLQNKNKSESS